MDESRNNEQSESTSVKKVPTTRRKVLLWSVLAVLALALIILLARMLGLYTPVRTKFVYNPAEMVAVATDEPFGWYDIELTPEEAASFLPEQLLENMQNPVCLHFSNTNQLTYVQMNVNTSVPGKELYIWAIQTYPGFRYRGIGKPVISKCGDVLYTLYRGINRNPNGAWIGLGATAKVDGVDWYFSLYGDETQEAQVKADFEAVLTCFAQDFPTADEIWALEPKGEPQEYTEKLTRYEALADPDFGAFVPTNMPGELLPRYFLRIKNESQNELSCRWAADDSSGASIDWDIEEFHGVNTRQDSWPFLIENLELANMQAILDGENAPFSNFGAKRYAFSVVFDEIIVHIVANEVELELLYDLITSSHQE